MSDCAILIFTKNPELGKVKTRLAKTIGKEKALNIYKNLLLHTKNEVLKTNIKTFIFYYPNILKNDIWNELTPIREQQKGNDLGEKMYNAFETVFNQGIKKAILIGTDVYNQNAENINLAFSYLEKYDVVFNPVEDGGYCLVGLKSNIKSLFLNKKWSHENVFREATFELEKLHKSYFALPQLNDIDTEEDLIKYKINNL